MTITHRKRQLQPEEITNILKEPGVEITCDGCNCDLTHSIHIKCADPICDIDSIEICPPCFCSGKEFKQHLRGHEYRIIEPHSYPIFTEDWGADEELLLLEGISLQGIGNWKKIAEHVGTRTAQEVQQHYNSVYVDSPDWPLPRMDLNFDHIDPADFHERKRRRISEMNATAPPPPKIAPTSAPGVHEIATFLPGRLEFEHELDNEAEDLVKDLEFGVVLEYGGDEIMEDENDLDVKARLKWEEEKKAGIGASVPLTPVYIAGKGPVPMNGAMNGVINGYHPLPPSAPLQVPLINGDSIKREAQPKSDDADTANGMGSEDGTATAAEGDDIEEITQPPPIETPDSLKFKLTLMEMYAQRLEKRAESKAIMFERGLLEYKKMQAAEKKRPKEEKEIIHRLRPFARLQTAEDYEAFSTDILYEAMLRKRIQELQHYRRLGLSTAADIEKYDADFIKRTQAKAAPSRDYYAAVRNNSVVGGRQSSGPDPRRSIASFPGDSEARKSHERESTPKLGPSASNSSGLGPPGRRPPAPLNLANSPSLHLLTPAEQTLCSQLRILPKPYLVIKETLVREYARRGGKLRRREARDLVKIDVNKTSRVWDFLVQAGFLRISAEPVAAAASTAASSTAPGPSQDTSSSGPVNGFTIKTPVQTPPRPLMPPPPSGGSGSQNGSTYSVSTAQTPISSSMSFP